MRCASILGMLLIASLTGCATPVRITPPEIPARCQILKVNSEQFPEIQVALSARDQGGGSYDDLEVTRVIETDVEKSTGKPELTTVGSTSDAAIPPARVLLVYDARRTLPIGAMERALQSVLDDDKRWASNDLFALIVSDARHEVQDPGAGMFRASLKVDLTSKRRQIIEGLPKPGTVKGGRSLVHDGLGRALTELRTYSPIDQARSTIVVFSGGAINGNSADSRQAQEMVNTLAKLGVNIVVVAFDPMNATAPPAPSGLQALAESTGGTLVRWPAEGAGPVDVLRKSVAATLAHYYRFKFRSGLLDPRKSKSSFVVEMTAKGKRIKSVSHFTVSPDAVEKVLVDLISPELNQMEKQARSTRSQIETALSRCREKLDDAQAALTQGDPKYALNNIDEAWFSSIEGAVTGVIQQKKKRQDNRLLSLNTYERLALLPANHELRLKLNNARNLIDAAQKLLDQEPKPDDMKADANYCKALAGNLDRMYLPSEKLRTAVAIGKYWAAVESMWDKWDGKIRQKFYDVGVEALAKAHQNDEPGLIALAERFLKLDQQRVDSFTPSPIPHRVLAMLYQQTNQPENTLHHCSEAYDRNDRAEATMKLWIETLLTQGTDLRDVPRVIDYSDELDDSQKADLWMKLGEAYCQSANQSGGPNLTPAHDSYKKAAELLKDDLTQRDDCAKAWFIAGDMSGQRGKLEEAVAEYEAALNLYDSHGKQAQVLSAEPERFLSLLWWHLQLAGADGDEWKQSVGDDLRSHLVSIVAWAPLTDEIDLSILSNQDQAKLFEALGRAKYLTGQQIQGNADIAHAARLRAETEEPIPAQQ